MRTLTRTQQIHDVSQQYGRMQGLRWVPGGIGALLFSLTFLLSFHFPLDRRWGVATFFCFVVTFVGERLVTRYYKRTFGDPVPMASVSTAEAFFTGLYPERITVSMRILGGLGVAVVIGVLTIAGVPIFFSLVFLLVAGEILRVVYLLRFSTLPSRLYWVVGSAPEVIVALVLAAPISAFAWLHTFNGMFVFLSLFAIPAGLAQIVCGLLEHRLLVRNFTSISKSSRRLAS